ncbi:MAG: efflux RND transporter periplasmic adaptor subunit [Desulfosarcinaceae bacterium]|nr:efflux RND transporter periplasmic adaptor subunit [Desulfosarcinaceae bacterium]
MNVRSHLIAALLAGLLLAACGEKIEPGHTAPGAGRRVTATVVEARLTEQPFLYEAVATIAPRTAATLSSKLMGTIRAIHVRAGDRVAEGDLLVVVDQRQVTAQLTRAEAGLQEARRAESSALSAYDAAKAAATLAASTYTRYKQLLASDSVSQQEFDEVEARHRQAQAAMSQSEAMLAAARSRVRQAEATVESAVVGKKDAQVRAPYTGKITAKLANEGDLASPGTPFLTIEKEGEYDADLVLPERHIQAVSLNMPVQVKVPAIGETMIEGRIDRIVPLADARSRSFQLKVRLPQTGLAAPLRSGMFARVSVPVGKAGLLLVPTSAIISQGQLDGVFKVDGEQIARFRLVRVGRTYVDRVEILSGLKPGERFVPAPPVTLADGARIEAGP